MRSAELQIAAMRRDWPDFRLVGRAGGRLRWRGRIRPLSQSYLVEIELPVPKAGKYGTWTGLPPKVTVVSPGLARRTAEPDVAIPHIYKNDDQPSRQKLCLYDPKNAEWSQHQLVAESIVPWTIEWLACYEVWHATGEWVGGGRHPGEPVEVNSPTVETVVDGS